MIKYTNAQRKTIVRIFDIFHDENENHTKLEEWMRVVLLSDENSLLKLQYLSPKIASASTWPQFS